MDARRRPRGNSNGCDGAAKAFDVAVASGLSTGARHRDHAVPRLLALVHAFFGIESPGHWTGKAVLCACLFGVGILVELWTLFRSLELRDDEPVRYTGTVRWFFGGASIVIVGVIASILVAD